MSIRMAAALAAMATAAPLAAADGVSLAQQVYVERATSLGGQAPQRVLEPARALRKGDRVIYLVEWRSAAGETFHIVNPLPRTVAFQRAADPACEVSVDGGRSWGRIGALTLRERDGGVRLAAPEDVTHVRFQVPRRLALAGQGRISWSAVVR